MENIESGVQTLYFEYNRIQMIAIGSDPYFNLEDVCEILKIKDTKRAKARLDEQGVCDAMTFTSSGFQKKDFISETNLYRLIFMPVFIRNKVAKELIKDLENLREKDLEELKERNNLK